MKKDYEAPALTLLGTVSQLTLLNQPGPNVDLQLNLGSVAG